MPRAAIAHLLDDSHGLHPPETLVYEPGGAQKTVFAFVVLLLAPFYASLPPMLYQRFAAGVWLDTWGLVVIAVAFTILMALLIFELIYALAARVEVGAKALEFTLPRGGPGALPTLAYETRHIDYDEIAAVEQRAEVYGGTIAPVVMVSTWIRTKSDERVLLGAVNRNNVDHVFPFTRIAEQVAERAGVDVIDIGMVKRPVRDAVLGMRSHEAADAPLPDEAVASVNSRHRQFVYALLSVFVCLLALGLAVDFLNGSTDLGERAPNTPLPDFIRGLFADNPD